MISSSAVRGAIVTTAAIVYVLLAGCGNGTPYEWNLPYQLPAPEVPADNPMTLEKVELGRRLFSEKRLSGNGTQSCASCHQPEHAFSEPAATATGSTGQKHRRNTMALVNVAYNATFTWAHSGIQSLEQHAMIPLFGDAPVEMGAGGREAEILEGLASDPVYRDLFQQAFPREDDPITFDNVAKAIASFVRTLISFGSAFDRYAYAGEDSALTEAQIRGMNLFMSERLECSHCHNGFNFSQFVTHESNVAAERPFHVTGLHFVEDRNARDFDFGLAQVTGNEADRDMFKAPTLRNVAYTAPYMHDGSLATLEEVIDFYAAGGRELADGPFKGDGREHPRKSPFIRGFTLTPQEKADVIAFLYALSDEKFLEGGMTEGGND